MDHRRAIQLLEIALDRSLSAPDLLFLEDHLENCPACQAYADRLADLDESLRVGLQKRYPQIPAQEKIASTLGRIDHLSRRVTMRNSIFRSLSWIAAAAVLVFLLVWSIQNVLPQPPTGAISTPTADAPVLDPTLEIIDTLTKEPAVTPTATPVQTSTQRVISRVFPNLQIQADRMILPEESAQVPLFVQSNPETASPDLLRQTAIDFGLQAPIFQQAGEGSEPVYLVSDGHQMMTFAYNTAQVFDYWRDYAAALVNTGEHIPFEEAAPIAEAYLQSLGLLDFEYRIESIMGEPGWVRFVQILEGRPVIYGIGYSPSVVELDVRVGPEGEIQQVRYYEHDFQPLGDYPIVSAQQAWQAVLSGAASDRMRYALTDPNEPASPKGWARPYPVGERVDLYGYPYVLEPVEQADTPLAFLSNMPVVGDLAAGFASQVTPYEFLHAWGIIQADEQGLPSFNLAGWEVSLLENLHVPGEIERQEDQVWLSSERGRLALPGAPEELKNGDLVIVSGVLPEPETFDWALIQSMAPLSPSYGQYDTCGGGGGGGSGGGSSSNDIPWSFGGGSFRLVDLTQTSGKPPATPLAISGPYQIGDVVEGVSGTINAIIHRFADGSERLEVDLLFEEDGKFWRARLDSPGEETFNDYQSLPLRIWGNVTAFSDDGQPIIRVERFEEVYPGLRIEAWMGAWELITLDGREVLLFTSDQGQAYVLSHSIEWGLGAAVGIEGDRVVVEGIAVPDNTFGGYPIIDELGIGMVGNLENLDNYEISSSQPGVRDDAMTEANWAAALEGQAELEQVELVYAAASLQRCGDMEMAFESTPPWLYVQPVWRFILRMEDGRQLEIQIQALAEEYLQ